MVRPIGSFSRRLPALAALALAALLPGVVAAADIAPAAFEAVGHTYAVDFGGGNAFDIRFDSDREMTFTKRQPPGQGQVETVRFRHRRLREGLYLVYWQEADRTSVVHVEDFARGTIYTNITRPDGSFFNGQSPLTKIQ